MAASSSEPDRRERRAGWWSSRLGLPGIRSYLERFHVPEGRSRWQHALGGALVVTLALEVFSGLMLLLYYRPEASLAHASVAHIVDDVRFGWLLRSLHRDLAHAVVLLALLHGLAAFTRRGFRAPREITWLTGLVLGASIAAFAYSGQILPWDLGALHAAQVGASLAGSVPVVGGWLADVLRGGPAVGPDTLRRAYVLHVGVLPALLFASGALHVYLVHAHGLSTPSKREAPGTSLLAWLPRAGAAWLVLVNVVLVIAALAPASLGPAADVTSPSTGLARPAWYFVALFQLARSSVLGAWPGAAVLLIAAVSALLAAAPWWASAEKGWRGPRAPLAAGLVLVIGFVALTVAGYGG